MKKVCGMMLALSLLLSGMAPAFAESGGEAKLLCLNIGKADCLLLFCGEKCWLVDAGYEQSYGALETALKEYGVERLDGVFLTHCHKDHSGGLAPLAQSAVPIDAWYAAAIYYDVKAGQHPAALAAQARGQEVAWLSAGDVIPAGDGASFTVLGPVSVDEDNENNNSLVLLFASPAGSILLCGDMKEEEEAELADEGRVSACTLMKVGHHGDSAILSKRFLAAARPAAAVISTSTEEEADTPAPSTLRKLKEIGCDTYVTQDCHDAILFTLDGGKVTGVDDITWSSVPPRTEGITMEIDAGADTVTLRNTGAEAFPLGGCTLYSNKGDETLALDGPVLAPGESWVIGGRKSEGPVDQTWDEKNVWSKKKRDVDILYDPWGRPVARADNGLDEN